MIAEDSRKYFPDSPLTLPVPNLDQEQWDSFGQTLMTLIDINLGNRAGFDRMLNISNAMYEMRTGPRNVPWPNAANLVTPKVPEKVDEVTSRVCGTVFQPRLFTVTGNDPLSAQYAHSIEQFYNNEAQRNEWIDPLETCVHLSARDGVAYAEVMWDLSVEEQVRWQRNPNGPPEKKLINLIRYDAPRITAREARDVVFLPNFVQSVEAAPGYACKIYMEEFELWRAVNGGYREDGSRRGIFDADRVEQALSYVGPAQGELSYDRQPPVSYTIGGQIVVSDTTVQAPTGIRMERGPLEIWQVHSRLFYIDNNGNISDDPRKGKPQECICWVHDRSRIMLGIAPYEYWGGRPLFDLSLWPRPNRIYGFGVPWRIKGPVEEKNAIHIGRLDYMDMATQPMRWVTKNARFRDEARRWGPDGEVEVTKGSGLSTEDFGYVGMPPWPQIGDAEEDRLDAMIEAVVASPQAPATVQPGQNAQRSARAAQTDAMVRGMASNAVNKRVRKWLLRIFKFTHSLYQQYGPDEMETVQQTSGGTQRVVLPRELFGLDYTLGIAGMGGALDKEARRQDMLQLAMYLAQTPLVQGNLPRIWNIARLVVETFDVPEVTALIGTLDEANTQAQMQQAAQQNNEQKQMLMAILSHGAFKPNAQATGSRMTPFGSARPARQQPGLSA